MFFGTEPATVEQLRQVEEITVEQEMEMAWEARVKLTLCLDDRGNWVSPPNTTLAPFTRMRIEVKLGSGDFKPLIDGPIAAFDTQLSANPGTSTVSLVVRDDLALMNREDATEVFEELSHSTIASQTFGAFPSISSTRIGSGEGIARRQAVTVRRGTSIQFLRELARVHGFMAYVLPGEEAGQSLGVFDAPATDPTGAPALVLMGANRNLQSATFRDDAEGPERTRGRSLTVTDQQIVSSERSFQDQALMGALPAVSDDQGALRELPAENNATDDPADAMQGRNLRASYGMRMTARLLPGCYDTVLRAYDVVEVQGGTLPNSGNWLIHKVTHRITPSIYTQEIEGKRNARSETGSGAISLGAAAGLF